MKLYDIPAEAEQIESLLEESQGELTPEIEQKLKDFVEGGKEKLEHAAAIVKSLTSQAGACKEEASRLSARKASLEANADRLKALMLTAVDGGFNGKIKTSFFTIWGQTSKATVSFSLAEGVDPWTIPEEFSRVVAPELDKVKLQQAHKEGKAIPEIIKCEEKPGIRFLQIR
jgi:hypothetical protein